MSCRSGCIDHLIGAENLAFAPGIPQRLFLDQVHGATEKGLKLLFHLHQVPQAPRGIRLKNHKDVNVTIRAEIVPQNRAEERQLCDFPFSTELGKFVF